MDIKEKLRSQIGDDVMHIFDREALFGGVADRIEALEAENAALREALADAKRRLGGGCDATGGQHMVCKDGNYAFCGNCGESLEGVRFIHAPRAALARQTEGER